MATASLTRPSCPKPPRLWTYTELRAEWPETNQPIGLWNGEIVTAPSPSPGHRDLIFNLARAFPALMSRHDWGRVCLSPLDVVLSERRVVQPDLVFAARENLGIVRDCIRDVPDLTLEVVSETSWHSDRIGKKALYEQFGVKEYWLVDPDGQTIEVFALGQKRVPPVLEGHRQPDLPLEAAARLCRFAGPTQPLTPRHAIRPASPIPQSCTIPAPKPCSPRR
jgi:Uma2 family endonuclease